MIPLQNTTQQPILTFLTDRATRQAIFENSWKRAERGDANDTRADIARLAQLRAEKGALLGYPNYAAWTLTDQMAKTPKAAINFMDALTPAATAKAPEKARTFRRLSIRNTAALRSSRGTGSSMPSRCARRSTIWTSPQIRPYFELNSVLQNGVFFAANKLYGITFKELKDIPVYQPDVRVFEVFEADGKPLALWYCDYYKRDNKNGGAWMDSLVAQSKLLGFLPVVFNVANFEKPAPGSPRCSASTT